LISIAALVWSYASLAGSHMPSPIAPALLDVPEGHPHLTL
jgi:hypothetical protein